MKKLEELPHCPKELPLCPEELLSGRPEELSPLASTICGVGAVMSINEMVNVTKKIKKRKTLLLT